MRRLAARLGWLGLDEIVRLAQVVRVELLNERLVGGFREHTLLLKDGQPFSLLLHIYSLISL